jgi:FAD/FMN-containing dehydrogenase
MVTESALAGAVGKENVSEAPAALEAYAGDMSFVGKVRPRFVAKVGDLQTLQALMALAKETGTPLVPVSSGPPHFHGDTVPSTGDAVIVDLSGMKKIDLIDPFERVASIVEPGVTFGELITAVAEKGLRLNMPLQPRATKSVVGSMLSREPVIMPHYHWDISDPIGSTEVVFGTGDMFRTGAAAGPGGIAEQRAGGGVQKEAAGPSAMSLHRLLQGAQGTMGIVTWASVRCELLPEKEKPYFIASSDVAKLMEAAHWLIRLRLGNELLILSAADMAALMTDTDAAHARLIAKLPPWVLFFNLAAYKYFPDMRLQGQVEDTRDLLQRLGLQTVQNVGGVAAPKFLESIRRPSDEPYWKLRRQGGCQDIFFLTTNARIPGLVKTMTEVAEAAGYRTGKMGVYLQPVVQGTGCHVEFNLFYNPADQAEASVVRELATRAIQPLMNAGAFFSRPFGEAAKQIMNRDAAGVEALKKVKTIVDPAGILNPGRLCF